jgi:putative membrane protein
MAKPLFYASQAVIVSLLLFSGSAVADEGDKKPSAKRDQQFAKEAAMGGMAEVELGRLAADKAQSEEVKEFAEKMVEHHQKANEELNSIASEMGMTLPTDMGSKHSATKERLSKLSGAEFDRAYMKYMLSDHKKDIANFEKQANRGENTKLKEFASETLPTLREHLETAQGIAAKTGAQSADRMKQP